MIFILMITVSRLSSAQVRTVQSKTDGIASVRTSLGIATIIQLPEAIQSAIIGDSSAFKVEYLDRAITIKPLRSGARSNLYLVTAKRRYNLRLSTQGQASADYIVYLRDSSTSEDTRWRAGNAFVESKGVKLSLMRVGKSSGGFILLELKLESKTIVLNLRPEELAVTQNGSSRAINTLYASELKPKIGVPIMLGLSVARADLTPGAPLKVEIGKLGTKLIVKEGLLWN